MTKNGLDFVTKGDTHLNLKVGMCDDYSKFIVDFFEHFEKKGFHFNYVSPVNEPK
jgi:O-glycosyl hydrolase|tara:strand:+ start:55517 stop:55681 length:165 start_codon:yes stop_codon:yes gene_type:complete